MPVFVALSTVADGNMYIPESQADEQVIATRMAWLKVKKAGYRSY